jgi:hypothetical protein
MLVDLTNEPPELREVDDLKRLHVLAPTGLDVDRALRTSGLGSQELDGRVLLGIAALRAAGSTLATGPGWADDWDAMVAYAGSKGWVADDGSALVAHVERTQ